MIDARNLRDKAHLGNISNERPGYYKWWADEETFREILTELEVGFEEIEPYVEKQGELYCVYVGIAANESIRNRLNWHVNDSHTLARVKNGTLSTLRQSISSLVAHDQSDKEATDNFIDRLKIEYFENENPIGSPQAKEELRDVERALMQKNLYVLNIQENRHEMAGPIRRRLRKIRREGRERALAGHR